MKISKQATNEKRKVKYELGNFCEQYGMPSIAVEKINIILPLDWWNFFKNSTNNFQSINWSFS